MKRSALASLAIAFATAFALADGYLGTPTLVGDLSSTTNYVYQAAQVDTLVGARVPANRTVNGHALTGNVTVGEGDISVTPGYGSTVTLGSWIDSVDGYLGQIVPVSGTSLLGIMDGKLVAGSNSTTQYDLNINGTNVIAAIQAANAAAAAAAYTHPAYTARTGKPTANQTPAFGGSFTVSQITSDSTGHVTGATDRTITIPSAAATTTASGLMSATDKTNLDALSSGAVTKSAVSAALTAQGIASTDNIDTLNETIAELKKIIAVLEALD